LANPHDAFFHYIFSQPANAADLARGALPPVVAAMVDWTSLAVCDGKLTDGASEGAHADLLFTADILGTRCFLFLLLEHKSHADPQTAFQMLRYIVRIWERHRAVAPQSALLPPVLPIVVHHGAAPWNGADTVRALVDVTRWPRAAANAVLARQPDLRLTIDDLAAQSEAQLAARVSSLLGKCALLCMQHLRGAPPDAAAAALLRWRALLAALWHAPHGQAAFLALVHYIVMIVDLDRSRLREIFRIIEPMTEDTMIYYEGRIPREAAAKGRQEGRAELLLRLLHARFGPPPADVAERVRAAAHDEIDAWSIRLLDAKCIDDVFG
jgi:hypothetical protein